MTDLPPASSEELKVLLVDDHPIVRERLGELIAQEPDLVVCGEAADGPAAVERALRERPGWEEELWEVERVVAERAARPDTVELWQKVTTAEDAEWTRRYHSDDPAEKAFGGRVVIRFIDGSELVDEIAVADASTAVLMCDIAAQAYRRRCGTPCLSICVVARGDVGS